MSARRRETPPLSTGLRMILLDESVNVKIVSARSLTEVSVPLPTLIVRRSTSSARSAAISARTTSAT